MLRELFCQNIDKREGDNRCYYHSIIKHKIPLIKIHPWKFAFNVLPFVSQLINP